MTLPPFFSHSAPRTRGAFYCLKGSKVKKSLIVTADAGAAPAPVAEPA